MFARTHSRTNKRARTIIRTGSAGLILTKVGPYLAWVSLRFLERMPGLALRLLPPFRLLRKAVRDVAPGRGG